MARRLRRNLLRGLIGLVLLFAGALATLPWWWPAVLQRVNGVTMADAVTSGWSTVELQDVRYAREGLEISAASVRVPAFGVWPAAGDDAVVVARDVAVRLLPAESSGAPPPSVRRIFSDVLDLWSTLERWLPAVRVQDLGIVSPDDGAMPVRLDEVRWDGTQLTVEGSLPGREEAAVATIDQPESRRLRLTVSAPTLDASLTANAEISDEDLEVVAQAGWRDTAAEVRATFGAEGWLPQLAVVDAPNLSVPAADLGLSAYGAIAGSLHLIWTGDSYSATVVAHADPMDPEAALPPLEVDVRAGGDFAHVTVESVDVRIPGVEAHLSSPVVFQLPQGIPSAPATFELAVNLVDLPQVPAQGEVTGRVAISGGPGTAPAAEFSLSGSAIRWRNAEIPRFVVAGAWEPDQLRVSQVDVELGESSEIHASGALDLQRLQVTDATLTVDATSTVARVWWPEVPEFARLTVEAQADGPWDAPQHSGQMSWEDLAAPGGMIDGDLSWDGQGIESATLDGSLRAPGEVTVPVAAGVNREGDGTWHAELTQLGWQDAQGWWWQLANAVNIEVDREGIRVANFNVTGDELALELDADVTWPARGEIFLEASGISASRVAPLLGAQQMPVTLERVSVNASWDNGPLQVDGSASATYASDGATPYSMEAEFRSESAELVFGAVRAYSSQGVVLEGEARLPLALAGRDEGFEFSLPQDAAMSLELDSTPNPEFWASVTKTTGWEIEAPDVQVQLHGSVVAPEGRIEFSAETLRPPLGREDAGRLPRFGDVNVIVLADAAGVRVDQAIWTLDGNWVSLQGRMPWSVAAAVRETRSVPWRDIHLSFGADRLPMSIASRAVPRVLAPDGTVSLKFDHEPGQGFDGFLWLENAGLRPIQPVGAVRDIGGRVLLDGYRLTLRNVTAYLGGRPVQLGGRANLEDLAHPAFDVHLLSSGVPLVRQEGLVVRAALDLRVQQTPGQPAQVSGSAELGRSVFVSDLVGLLPTGGGVERPEQRPPYFSVAAEPFAGWQLDVDVNGTEFLHVQSPFFRSVVSAQVSLHGTLENPRAEGRVWTQQGTIIFPFGSLEVEEGEVALTPQDPHRLALRASASTRLYGYDIRLNASGSAQDPQLQFSSEPPLSSQQVFLMLSAGELPDEDNSFSTSERARRLAWFIGRNLASSFGLGGAEGGDRLEVRSGEDFSREGTETIYVQYDIDDRWSIVGEQDRFDAYNVGIKYRLIDR